MRDKFATAMVAVTMLTCGVTAVAMYGPAKESVRGRVRTRLAAAAASGALLVDAEEHARLKPGDEGSATYRRIKKRLLAFRNANPSITEVYTMVKTEDPDTYLFVMDVAEPEDENGNGILEPDEVPAKIGEPYDISDAPEMRHAFDGPIADKEPASDKWGTWLSGYAPIRDKSGHAVAMLGVDMTLDELRSKELATYYGLLQGLLWSLLGALVLAAFFATRLTKPIDGLVEAAHAVAQGNLDFRVAVGRQDEFGRLAEAFNDMVASLSADILTGLYNRRYFYERLIQEVARARRQGQHLYVLMCDLDGFKSVNDIHGHRAGDEVLKRAGAVIREALREYDVVARLGGDEFGVLLPETEEAGAQQVAERLLSQIELAGIGQVVATDSESQEKPRITGSIGIACYPTDAPHADALLLAADLAMLRSKHMGGSQISRYADLATTRADFGPVAVQGLIQRATWSALETLAAIVDARAPHVRAHSEVVARYAVLVAQEMDLPVHDVDQARAAGLLHDVGEIAVSDSILSKPGPLTSQEWEAVRQHPVIGATILSKIPHLDVLVECVRYHHERFDGTGYPEGLRGDAIPMLSRILAAADAYEAMTSIRRYRRERGPLSPAQALEELHMNAGSQFDPQVVDAMCRVVKRELAEIETVQKEARSSGVPA